MLKQAKLCRTYVLAQSMAPKAALAVALAPMQIPSPGNPHALIILHSNKCSLWILRDEVTWLSYSLCAITQILSFLTTAPSLEYFR